MHRTNLADIDPIKFNAGECAPVIEIGNIGELAAEPVKGLDDDNVKDVAIEIN